MILWFSLKSVTRYYLLVIVYLSPSAINPIEREALRSQSLSEPLMDVASSSTISKRRSPPPSVRSRIPSPTPTRVATYADMASTSTRYAELGLGPAPPGGESSTQGQYAYSTTLRRQSSLDPYVTTSPRLGETHHASPYRKRTESNNGYYNGRPVIDLSDPAAQQGYIARAVEMVRGLTGRGGYAEIKQDEEERIRDLERKRRETPSSVFAHKSVDVGPM